MKVKGKLDIGTRVASRDLAPVLTALDASGTGRQAHEERMAQGAQNNAARMAADQNRHDQAMQSADLQHKADMAAADRRSGTLKAGIVAGAGVLALGAAGFTVAGVMNNGITTQHETDMANATRVNTNTGDTNVCNTVVIGVNAEGEKVVIDLGAINPNDPRMGGKDIKDLIDSGKAVGANVTVGDTNQGTAIITMNANGEIVDRFVPAACKADPGKVFGPKA